MHSFNKFKESTAAVATWLQSELSQIRTGRAAPGIIDGVQVEAYDSMMPINQLASVTTEDARSLRVTPYDPQVTKAIEKALTAADLGLGVSADGNGLRLTFPALTTERRGQFVKLAKDRLEQARKSLRQERDAEWNAIQAKEKEGGMGEDEKFRLKDQMEKIVKDTGTKLEELLAKKEKEIME